MKFAKFLRALFSTDYLQWLVLIFTFKRRFGRHFHYILQYVILSLMCARFDFANEERWKHVVNYAV